jgi:hypothetical protein
MTIKGGTATEYALTIKTAYDKIVTPNLKGLKGDKGG